MSGNLNVSCCEILKDKRSTATSREEDVCFKSPAYGQSVPFDLKTRSNASKVQSFCYSFQFFT